MEPKKELYQKHLVYSLLFTLLFITAVSILYRFHYLERADLFLHDLHFKWRGPKPASGNVVLVLMDQKSSMELKRKKGAWSRRHMAKALENLCQAGAEIIGMDLVLFAPGRNKGEDLELAKAISKCNNVVLAKFISVDGRGEVVPLPVFQEAMIGDGFINMFPDKDGILRRIPFLSIKPLKQGLLISPSFSLELARTYLNLDFVFDFSGKDHVRLGANGQQQLRLPYPDLRINFLGAEEPFRRISFADVVNNQVPPETVKGKIVLIGSSLATDKDFFTTPLSGYKGRASTYKEKFGKVIKEDLGPKTVGVACHAHAIETILSQAFICKAPGTYTYFLIILVGLIGLIFYLQRPGALWGAVILFTGQGVVLGASYLLFVRQLLWIEAAPPMLILFVQFVSGIALQRAYSKKKTKLVTNLFGKYVSPSVVDDILEGEEGITLEGRSREVTVLFSDLRSFTTLSESLSPQETGRLLNTYFDAMIPIVFDHQGTLDKLIGDAIMAFFGAPGTLEDHPVKAAQTALNMIEKLDRLRTDRNDIKGIERLDVGVGLNTGQVIVGNLGSQRFMDYTVIGDTVNLGSRLEGLNKAYGTSIIISQSTAKKLDSRFVLRELDRVMVKGKADAVTIFELMGFKDNMEEKKLELVERFTSAINHYRNREWDQAQDTFEQTLGLYPEDKTSSLYLDRIRSFRENPPPPEWDGVTVFTTK
jgi:adenylate cyclase